MTLSLNKAINVTITRQTQLPQGPGFGIPLIIGPDTTGVIPLVERARSYSSIESVAVDFNAADEEYKAANAAFAQEPRPTGVVIGVRDALKPGSLGDELDAIQDVNDSWYACMLTADARVSDEAALALEAASWCESRFKLFLTASNEAAAIATGGAGGLPGSFNTLGYDRSLCFYHQDADADAVNSYPEAAFLGKMLTVNFDGRRTTKTGKWKSLTGIYTSPLTPNQYDALLGDGGAAARYGNAYVDLGGYSMVDAGTMGSGEFFDTMHGIDWLLAEVQFRVFGKLTSLNKVPYTDAGMEILIAQVRAALVQGQENGLIAPDEPDGLDGITPGFEVSAPSVFSVSAANRAARIAPPITFSARIAGAVHYLTVNGTVTV